MKKIQAFQNKKNNFLYSTKHIHAEKINLLFFGVNFYPSISVFVDPLKSFPSDKLTSIGKNKKKSFKGQVILSVVMRFSRFLIQLDEHAR